MLNPLRDQIASLMTSSARRWFQGLDKSSDLYRQLLNEDVDTVLKENVDRICAEMSFGEMCQAVSLAVRFKAGGKDRKEAEAEVKKIARGIAERVEARRGGFSGPACCRQALYSYLEEATA